MVVTGIGVETRRGNGSRSDEHLHVHSDHPLGCVNSKKMQQPGPKAVLQIEEVHDVKVPLHVRSV